VPDSAATEPDVATAPDAASRRRFLQLVAAASTAPWARAVLPGLGLAAAGQAAAQTSSPEETSTRVRALLDMVKAEWGERLSEEDLQVIERNLGWMQRSSQALRGAALQNSDEPDVIFRAEPPEVS
jgi:hypothetical protein